jgi:hypothetical protein
MIHRPPYPLGLRRTEKLTRKVTSEGNINLAVVRNRLSHHSDLGRIGVLFLVDYDNKIGSHKHDFHRSVGCIASAAHFYNEGNVITAPLIFPEYMTMFTNRRISIVRNDFMRIKIAISSVSDEAVIIGKDRVLDAVWEADDDHSKSGMANYIDDLMLELKEKGIETV